MNKKTVKQLAVNVNELFEEYKKTNKPFWAVGLLSETKEVWFKDNNRKYLNNTAQFFLDLM